MGCRTFNGAIVCGNFSKPRRYKNSKPKNWAFRDYAAIIPYPEKWERVKVGKSTICTCKEIIEKHEPWLGFTWFHENACAIMQNPRTRNSRVIWRSE